MNTKNKIIVLTFFLVCLFGIGLNAQSSMGGNLIIAENGSMTIYGNHNFTKGSGFVASGMIYTSKVGNHGYLLFDEGSSWTGATREGFVDGYVKVKHAQSFVFPVGDKHLYRPVAISGAANTAVAYFAKSPKKPLAKILTDGLGTVSDKEYWEVSGEQATHLSFLWGRESNVANITERKLDQLTIVGWKNGQWQIIPSVIKETIPASFAVSKRASNFDAGVILTKDAIVPNDFDYFTLASLVPSKLANPVVQTDVISVYPNPVVKELQVHIGALQGASSTIRIYNIDGREMTSRVVDGSSASTQRFDVSSYENGMYQVYLIKEEQTYTTEFVVGKRY